MKNGGRYSLSPAVAGGSATVGSPAPRYFCCLLPFPPSTNSLFPGKARRFKSKGYKDWIERAGWALKPPLALEHFGSPVRETISLGRPDKRVRDLANFEKAINDLLVAHNVLRDDSLIHDLRLRWDDEVVGALIEIEEL